MSHFIRACGRGQWSSEEDSYRLKDSLRALEEETAALKAEDASPDAVEVERNYRAANPRGDPLQSAAELQQIAGTGYGPFSEDAYHVAFLDFPPRDFERLLNFIRTVIRSDRDRMHHPEKPVQPFPFVIRAEHEKAHHPVARRRDQKRINPRHMICNEQGSFFGYVLLANGADAVQAIRC